MVGAQINHSQIEEYAKNIAELLGENHFANQDTINGQEILRLSEVKQINFLVLKNLFEKWQDETRNLRSPYFNFKNEKVTKALVAFMNILSQNIEVEKAAFMPLLTTAVQDTLYLTLTPFDHFWAELSQGHETLSIKNLKAKGKYIKQNKHIYDAFIERVEQAFDEKIEKADALNILEGLIQDGDLEVEDNSFIISELSSIHPIDIDAIYTLPEPEEEAEDEVIQSDEDLLSDLFDEETLVDTEESSDQKNTPEVVNEEVLEEDDDIDTEEVEALTEEEEEPDNGSEDNQDSFSNEIPEADEEQESDTLDELNEENQAQEEAEEIEASEAEEDHDSSESIDQESEESAAEEEVFQELEPEDLEEEPQDSEAQPQKKLVRKPSESVDNSEDDILDNDESLNKKYSQEKTTINDQLKDQDKMTIADIHETQPTGKMQESISVNQRYMFVNELFSGNAEHYNKAISDIERCESFDDSVELMIQKYAKKLDWNMNSPEVKELLKVIFKRYR